MPTNGWRCQVSEDNSSATIFIDEPAEGEKFSVDDIVAFLRQHGIMGGFIYSAMDDIIRKQIYYKDVVVARSTEPVDGVDGHFDFFFDTGKIKHPNIRSDGSVDYQSMSIIHSIQKGDVLAVYHPAVQGRHGVDIRGREKRCKVAKEIPALKGVGFETITEKDGSVTYKSLVEGRVEYNNNKLFVRDVYELRGDLDLITGRVDFRGDVVIHGNVCAGTVIRASKSITVEGNVEAAVLIAEGDIILKKGMQGGKRAKITCGGTVYAYFLEYTEVTAKGNVEANIILNCKVSAGNSIIVKGKKGYIVGGTYNAPKLISSTNIGNQAMVKTITQVGNSVDQDVRNHLLTTKYESTRKSIESSKQGIESLYDSRINKDPKEVRDAKLGQLRRRLKRDERLLEHIAKELEEIRQAYELCQGAKVVANGVAFQGLCVRIDNKEFVLDKNYERTEFYRPGIQEDIRSRTV